MSDPVERIGERLRIETLVDTAPSKRALNSCYQIQDNSGANLIALSIIVFGMGAMFTAFEIAAVVVRSLNEEIAKSPSQGKL